MNIATALTLLALHAPLPGHVTVLQQPCPDYPDHASCAHLTDATIYLDPALKRDGRWTWRYAFAHELGHIWDYQHLDDAARASYSRQIYESDMDWLSDSDQADLMTDFFAPVPPGEQFADTYALCAMGPKYRRWNRTSDGYIGAYGESIRPRVVANTCWLLHHPPR